MSSMTRTEIIERIEQLKDNIFYLNMKDRWTFDDRRTIDRWHREVRILKGQLQTMEAD